MVRREESTEGADVGGGRSWGGPGGGGWGGEKSLEGGTAFSRGKVRGLISVRQVRPSEGNRNLLWQVQLGWKVQGRSEVEPHFPSWMPPDQRAEATDSQVDFFLFPFVDARATGMADGICPVRSMRLEIAVNLAMAVLAASNSRAPVHPCVCPPCVLLVALCCISPAGEDQAEGRCLECLVCWLTSPRPNGRRSIDPVTEAAVRGTRLWTRWEKEKTARLVQAKHTPRRDS